MVVRLETKTDTDYYVQNPLDSDDTLPLLLRCFLFLSFFKQVVATTLVYFRQGHRVITLLSFSWLLDNYDSQNKRRSALWLAHYKKAANDFGRTPSFESLCLAEKEGASTTNAALVRPTPTH